MTTYDQEFLSHIYFLRRLQDTSKLTNLPATSQFNLARSTVPDSAIRDLQSTFGAKPTTGWGITDMMDHVIRSDPATMPVEDLGQLQSNLVQAGYLPPDTLVDGQWGGEFQAAVSRFESDNKSKFYGGQHPGSIPVMQAIAQLGNIMPSRVFQGLVGAAKGLVLQTPETVGRVGALGGAAGGAAIGASLGTLGGPLAPLTVAGGAIGGAVIGGVVGILGDIFSHEPDEVNQTIFQGLIDSLTPFEEYSGDPKKFFEDFGYIATASSMILGVGAAAEAAVGVAGAAGAEAGVIGGGARGLAQVGGGILEAGGTGGDVLASVVGKATSAELNSSWMARIAGKVGGLMGKDAETVTLKWIGEHGLAAQLTRPILGDFVQPVFSGLSEAQMGARLFSGMGAGGNGIIDDWSGNFKIKNGRDPTEDERDAFAAKHAPTTIEQAIAGAPRPQTGIEIPFIGDLVDMPGWIIYPSHILPWRIGDMGVAVAGRMGGTETYMKPFLNVNSRLTGEVGQANVASTLDNLGSNDAERFGGVLARHEMFGIHKEAERIVKEKGLQLYDPAYQDSLESARYQVQERLIEETGETHGVQAAKALKRAQTGKKSDSMLDKVMSWSFTDPLDKEKGPGAFEGYLMELEAQGSGIEKGPTFLQANELARQLTIDVRDGTRIPTYVTGKEALPGKVLPGEAYDVKSLQIDVDRLRKDIELRIEETSTKQVDDRLAMNEYARIEVDQHRLAEMETQLHEMRKYRPATWDERAVVPMRVDKPSAKDFNAWSREYKELAEKTQQASLDGDVEAAGRFRSQIVAFLDDHAEYIPPKLTDRISRSPRPDVGPLTKHFKNMAKKAAVDLVYDDATMKRMADLGYKPVLAKSNNVFYVPDPHLTEVLGMGDYSRRANVMESLGLGLTKESNSSINAARSGHQKYEVAQTLDRLGHEQTAQQVYSRLWSALRGKRSGMAVTNESIRSYQPWAEEMVNERGILSVGKRAMQTQAIDIRDLKPTDVYEAVRDWGWSYDDAREIYGAIKRGGAFGGELHLLHHPIQAAHLLAKNLRVSGWPGLTDVLRTWHAEMPGELPKGLIPQPKAAMKMPESLRGSPEVLRSTKELRVAMAKANLSIDQAVTRENAWNAMIAGAVEGTGKSADEIAGRLHVGYAEEYAADGQQVLLKRIREAPTHEELQRLVSTYSNTGGFSDYVRSEEAIRNTFGGRDIILGDGKAYALDDVMAQVIAISSNGTKPVNNLTLAEKAIAQHLEGLPISGVGGRAGADGDAIIADILSGNTVHKWSPELYAERKKQMPFYEALTGNQDALVIDRRIKLIHGLDPNADLSPLEEQEIRDWYASLRDQISGGERSIRSVQASIWVGFNDHMTERYAAALEKGDLDDAAKLKEYLTESGKDPRDYADSLANPTKMQQEMMAVIEKYIPPPEVLQKRVLDQVLGSTTFGEDYNMFMTIYKGADFSTFVHEEAHILRRLLTEDQIAQLEKTYNLPHNQGPLQADEAIRNIAKEYHESSGIPYTHDLVDQYPEVNEFRAREIADAYENTPHAPQDPEVKAAYRKFTDETMAQYDTLMAHGFHLEPWAGKGEPYKNSAEFIKDVRENKHLYYFKTVQEGESFGAQGFNHGVTPEMVKNNPLLASSGHIVKDSAGNDYEQTYNDIFRAVHDVFAHAKEGVQTGARGEESAWRAHAAMYSPEARRAMTTETRGQNSWVNYGQHLRDDAGNIAKKGEPGFVRPEDRPFAEQKIMLLPKEYSRLENTRWTREAEEKFATDAERYWKSRLAESDKKAPLESLRQSLGNSWARYRGYTKDQNLIDPALRRVQDEYYGDIFAKTKQDIPPKGLWTPGRRVAAGTAVGATLGYVEGDEKLDDAIRGAAMGAAGGLALNYLLKKSYGYLPDYLNKVAQALRFSLSPSFDARRFTKGQLLAMMNKEQLPFMGVAHRYIETRTWNSLYDVGRTVTKEEAWTEALRNFQEIHGVGYLEDMDAFDRTLTNAGILGYNPRQREIAYSYMMAQKGRSPEQIQKTMSEVFGYGYGRTAMEKSINYVFFPFSFEKKLLTTVGDFLLQGPGRAMLVYEGARRYHESKYDDVIGDFLDRHVPLLENLQNFNAFAHGISPGRFVLEGMWDHRTKAGEAAQVLSTFFLIPGGAAVTPVNQMMGGFGDLAVHAFFPIAVSGQSITDMGGDLQSGTGVDQILAKMADYIPMVTDLHELFTNAHDQALAITEGEAPWAQMHDYLDEQNQYKASLETIARLTGHSSVDGYLQSSEGALANDQFIQHRQELRDKYPTGFQMTTGFEDSSQLGDHAMYQVQKLVATGRGSQAEEAIAQIGTMEQQEKMLESRLTSLDPAILGRNSGVAIREFAMGYANDARFVELWNQILAWKYGPIRITVA